MVAPQNPAHNPSPITHVNPERAAKFCPSVELRHESSCA